MCLTIVLFFWPSQSEERKMKVFINFAKAWDRSARKAKEEGVKDDSSNMCSCYKKVTVNKELTKLAFGYKGKSMGSQGLLKTRKERDSADPNLGPLTHAQ